MKRFLLLCFFMGLVGAGAYYYFSTHPEKVPSEALVYLQKAQEFAGDIIEGIKQRLPAGEPEATKEVTPGASSGHSSPTSETASPIKNAVTLYLTNGQQVTGELVSRTDKEIVLRWDYGQVSFAADELEDVVAGEQEATAEREAPKAGAIDSAYSKGETVTLYLTNGGTVSGVLIHESPSWIRLGWDYGEMSFARSEIRRMVRSDEGAGENGITIPWEDEHLKSDWPHSHDVVFRLMSGAIIDAGVRSVSEGRIHFASTLESGGTIEQTIARSDIDQAMFRPLRDNEESKAIRARLESEFPDMRFYDEGMFTVVTDSPPPTVKGYWRSIRKLGTDWYLAFYPLTKGRLPGVQQYIVIFDDFADYIEHAASDGVPGWLAPGYFMPEERVLYAVNFLGERFSEVLSAVFLGQFREARDRLFEQAHGLKGNRREVFIKGQFSEFLQNFETTHARIREIYRQISVLILRHELTHAMFANWSLQNVKLSKISEEEAELAKEKREDLESDDEDKKQKLLENIFNPGKEKALSQTNADNSWYVEGLAAYMAVSPEGAINKIRLADAQEAAKAGQIMPLEFLNVFRMGSFPGIANQAKRYAYAQSWAFVHFLMHKHRKAFLAYLARLAHEQPEEGEDTLSWLLEAVGMKSRALEQEFSSYLSAFPPEEPMWLKQFQMFLDLRTNLRHTLSRLMR